MSFRPSNQHRPATDQLTQDFQTMFDQHPMAFSVVVFPATSEREDVTAGAMEDVVGSLESDERQLVYGAPFTTLAIEPQHGIEMYSMLSDGQGYGIEQEGGESLKLLMKEGPIPKRSVIAYLVDTGAGLALQVMYVMGADTINRRAAAGYFYRLIPYLGGLHTLDAQPDADDIAQADIVAMLDGMLTFESKVTSMEPPTGASEDSKIEALKADIDGLRFTYESREPQTVHVIDHRLGSLFVQADVWVQDPDGHYYRDVVNTQETSPDRMTVSLAVPANIKVVVKKGQNF